MTQSNLLKIDAMVNLALGALLIAFPTTLVQTLGIPEYAGLISAS